MSYLYESAILGGTFDHFHSGHKQFISTALNQASRLTIGIVQDSFISSKFLQSGIEDFATRYLSVESFIESQNSQSRCSIISIHDTYGTSLTDPSLDSIFVTTATISGANTINSARQKISLPPLHIVIVPFTTGSDDQVISSSRIREGIIDRTGLSHIGLLRSKSSYHLPIHLRKDFSTPLGPVVTNLANLPSFIPSKSTTISVGDIVSMDLKKAGYTPAVCVVDNRTRRKYLPPATIVKYFPQVTSTLENPAGSINPAFTTHFFQALRTFQRTNQTQIILVNGEEDLLALPAIILAPLGSYLVYGQYGQGMIIVYITENIKEIAKDYLKQF